MPFSVNALRSAFGSPARETTGTEHAGVTPDSLAEALRHDRLELVYLPRIESTRQQTIGLEALLRWPVEEDRGIPPLAFIPVAERSGLMPQITRWVLTVALGQLSQWQHAGLGLELSVNLSMSDVLDPELVPFIRAELLAQAIEPEWLMLEIPAHIFVTNPQAGGELTTRLRSLGAKVAIDDYASAYGTLPVPLESVDAVKIDRNFVLGMTRTANDAGVVAETLRLVTSAGALAIAEGVFSQWTWESLRSLGCTAAEGFYFSPPQPSDDITRWLTRCQWPAIAAKPLVKETA